MPQNNLMGFALDMIQHMEAIKVVYPSEYNAIVAKIRSLHETT